MKMLSGYFVFLSQSNNKDVDIRGEEGWSPLMCAARAGHIRIVKMLVDRSANLNLQTDSGWTALMLTAWLGRLKTVCLLLEAGADPDIEDDDHWTALRCAQSQGHHVIAIILGKGTLKKENGVKEAVITATESGCPSVLYDLLLRGANLDVARNELGESAFKIAAKYPQIKMNEFKEHIEELKRKKSKKPKESIQSVKKEAEDKSRKMAKIFLSQPIHEHNYASISNRISDITNFCDQKHFDGQIFGRDQKFYLKLDSQRKQTFIEFNNVKPKDWYFVLD